MKFPIWLGLALVLLAGHAGATNPTYAPIFAPMVTSGSCTTPPCIVVPNDAGHPWYFAQATGQGLALDASIQSLITILNAPLSLPSGAATSALQTAGNASLATLATASASQATAAKQDTAQTSLSTIATAQGAQGTGLNPPTGGSGILGFLSGIFNKASAIAASLAGTLTTADQNGAAFGTAVTLTAGGSSDSVGRSVEMLVTVAGNVSLQIASGAHIISVAASPYTQTFPYAVTAINSSGTTATATYANLH